MKSYFYMVKIAEILKEAKKEGHNITIHDIEYFNYSNIRRNPVYYSYVIRIQELLKESKKEELEIVFNMIHFHNLIMMTSVEQIKDKKYFIFFQFIDDEKYIIDTFMEK